MPSQTLYSEHSRPKRQNSSHRLLFLSELDRIMVPCLHVLPHSAEYKSELGGYQHV
jgi:hypothetical protein